MVRGGLLFGAFVLVPLFWLHKTKALGYADEPRDFKYSLAIASTTDPEIKISMHDLKTEARYQLMFR